MSKLTRDQVIKLASLSRLQLTNEEIEQYQQELSAILDYVEQLEQVDVKGLKPAYQVSGVTNVMRDDKVIDYQASAKVMVSQAPKSKDGYVQVGRMI